jgi:hypothetical protein
MLSDADEKLNNENRISCGVSLIEVAQSTSNVHRLPIHSSLDCKLGHHSPFRTFVKTGSICLLYSFPFQQSIALVQGK